MKTATWILTLSSLCLGQSAPSQTWVSFLTTKIKPETRLEYEGYMKEISAAYKKGGAPVRAVVENVYGDLNDYTSVTYIQGFASLDNPTLLVRVMGQDNWDHLSRNLAHCTLAQQRVAALALDDVTIRKLPPETYTFGLITRTVLAPGRLADYQNWLKTEYLPALKKGGVQDYWVNRSIFGGNLNEIVAVRWLKKMADLDGGPILVKAVGAEIASRIEAKTAGMIVSQHLQVVRQRPDLSYTPTQMR